MNLFPETGKEKKEKEKGKRGERKRRRGGDFIV